MKFPISCLPVNPPTCQKAEWSQVQLLNSHFVFQHNLRRLSNMKRLGGCWTIQKMDGWVDLGALWHSGKSWHRTPERERETQDSVGREETLVAARARVFLQVWTHLLLLFAEYDAKLLSSACPSTSRNHPHWTGSKVTKFETWNVGFTFAMLGLLLLYPPFL